MAQYETPRHGFRRINRKIIFLVFVVLLLVAYMLAVTMMGCACNHHLLATQTAQSIQTSTQIELSIQQTQPAPSLSSLQRLLSFTSMPI